jgi:glycerate 2-kinase
MLARGLAGVGVAAADPREAAERLVRRIDGGFAVGETPYSLARGARVVLLGAGKASLPIASALRDVLGDMLDGGVLVVRAGEAAPLPPVTVIEADHPLPSERSLRAGRALLAAAAELGEDDVALCCFTGGSSALASVPPPGLSFAEKQELHRLLLRSGMPIEEINAVRKHVSALKGGRLAAATRARIVNLTVSDVVGDRIDTITDPSVPDTTTAAGAVDLLRRHGLWEQVGSDVRAHLSAQAASPDLDGRRIQTVMLASGATACEAMISEAQRLEWPAVIVSTTLTGESREAGRFLGGLAAHCVAHHTPWEPPIVLLGCGGETTVTLSDPDARFAAGGPNQEMALAAALQIAGQPIAALFIDTDGSDGGTEVAGGFVDGTTAQRARRMAIDVDDVLRTHRSSGALCLLGDALRIAPTGTNVNDLFAIVIGSEERAP